LHGSARSIAAARHGSRGHPGEEVQGPGVSCAYQAQAAAYGSNLDPSDESLLDIALLPDPDKVRLRVYQTNSTHKSMSALRQGSMVLVKDVDYKSVEEQFHEAVFTHASTSPNLQIIASLDIARRQMELEGYELVNRAIQLALDIRREVNSHPLISKYFQVGGDAMIPRIQRQAKWMPAPGNSWAKSARALRRRVRLDVTPHGCAVPQLWRTSFRTCWLPTTISSPRATACCRVISRSTRSDVAALIRSGRYIEGHRDRLARGGEAEQQAFAACENLMKMSDLPATAISITASGRILPASRAKKSMDGFFRPSNHQDCEHVKLASPEIVDVSRKIRSWFRRFV
jgi:arginine decarboxylase